MKNIKKDVVDKIKRKEINIKPRWHFLAEEIEIKAGIAILLGIAAVGLSMIVLFWEVYNPRELMQFGDVGWQLLKEDFPYLWLLAALLLGVLGILLEKADGENYKKPKRQLALISLGIVLFLTAVIVLAGKLFQL